MDVFRLRGQLIRQYSDYVRSFIQIRDKAIQEHVAQRLQEGMLWPEPLIQLNPSFEPGAWISWAQKSKSTLNNNFLSE